MNQQKVNVLNSGNAPKVKELSVIFSYLNDQLYWNIVLEARVWNERDSSIPIIETDATTGGLLWTKNQKQSPGGLKKKGGRISPFLQYSKISLITDFVIL
jgi:hypothetical protein